jgi:hypothetical protein
MEDLKFYVLTKKVTIDPFKQGGLSKEEINIDQLKSDTFANTQEALRFDKYKIDKDYNPPLDEFRNIYKKMLSKKQGLQYLEWYKESIEIRIFELQKLLDFKLDYTINSIEKLDYWLNKIVNFTKSEKLTLESQFYCFDISTYITSMILKARLDIFLDIYSDDRRLDTYNEIVLRGYDIYDGKSQCNIHYAVPITVWRQKRLTDNPDDADEFHFYEKPGLALIFTYITSLKYEEFLTLIKKFSGDELEMKEQKWFNEKLLEHKSWEKLEVGK